MNKIVIKSYKSTKSIVPAIVLLIIGLLLFLNPGGIVEFLSYILGGVFITLGVSKFVSDLKHDPRSIVEMFYDLILIGMGLVFIFCSGTFEFIVRLVIGIWLIINGINSLLVGNNLVKVNSKNILPFIIGIITIAIGIYTIAVSNIVLSWIGLILMIYGILDIINCSYIYIKTK